MSPSGARRIVSDAVYRNIFQGTVAWLGWLDAYSYPRGQVWLCENLRMSDAEQLRSNPLNIDSSVFDF
jgi:hypothetical protein